MRNIIRDLTLGIFAVATCIATPARAELVSAADPQSIKAIVESQGWRSTLFSGGGGDPYIESIRNGMAFLVFFTNYDNGKNCKTLQYYMGFSGSKGISLERINAWNREKRFARAFIEKDGDAALEMDVDLDFRGLPRENIAETLTTWASLMDGFREFIHNK